MAAGGAFAQRQAVHEAFKVPHPYGRLEPASGDDGVLRVAERPMAVLAQPALRAVMVMAFADHDYRATARARYFTVHYGVCGVHVGVLVDEVAQ